MLSKIVFLSSAVILAAAHSVDKETKHCILTEWSPCIPSDGCYNPVQNIGKKGIIDGSKSRRYTNIPTGPLALPCPVVQLEQKCKIDCDNNGQEVEEGKKETKHCMLTEWSPCIPSDGCYNPAQDIGKKGVIDGAKSRHYTNIPTGPLALPCPVVQLEQKCKIDCDNNGQEVEEGKKETKHCMLTEWSPCIPSDG
eukprot:Pgem_evm1s17556